MAKLKATVRRQPDPELSVGSQLQFRFPAADGIEGGASEQSTWPDITLLPDNELFQIEGATYAFFHHARLMTVRPIQLLKS